jgi:cell division protein FtsQ
VSLVDAKPDPTAKSDDKERGASKRRWWKVPLAIALAAFFILLAPIWAPMLFRQMDFFRVRHVEVVGARYIQPREVLERLRVDTLNSVWDPTGPLETRVSGHPLVREVQIERKLPGTLVIRLVEHAPVALVATTGGFKAYDERGVALPIDPAASDVDAPILDRPDTLLLRLLGAARREAPKLYLRLSEVRRERRDELVLMLDSVPVRALADVTLERLADLELVEQDLARRRLRATELDVRYRDQVIARLPTP